MQTASILWRRRDAPGHEAAWLRPASEGWLLTGCAVFAHGRHPVQLLYEVACDSSWSTRSAAVAGWVGDERIEIRISADEDRRWELNGSACPAADGCIDVDLNFSPATNLLPIRRLDLPIGREAEVKAAWLRFPGFTLEPLAQSYRRIGPLAYRYQSGDGVFVRDLRVNELGFVTDYPDFWSVEGDD